MRPFTWPDIQESPSNDDDVINDDERKKDDANKKCRDRLKMEDDELLTEDEDDDEYKKDDEHKKNDGEHKKDDDGEKHKKDDEHKKGDDEHKKDDDEHKRDDECENESPPQPDYPNPLTVLTSLNEESPLMRDYVLLTDDGGERGTALWDKWWYDVDDFMRMFAFQGDVLRFVATKSNNSIGKIDSYVRSVAIVRDFGVRFAAATLRIRDWRLYVTMSAAHFARCLFYVDDRSVREIARTSLNKVMRDPYDVSGRDSIDPITAYRLSNVWILTCRAEHVKNWRDNANYRAVLSTLTDKIGQRNQWLYYEPLAVDAIVKLRDGGRLLQGRIPFYGDLWHRYVYIRNVRKMDDEVNGLVSRTSDFECLKFVVHTQVKYTCFGLFGPGVVVPSHWLWPQTLTGLIAIPSIGLLRMYEQRYSWSCRIMKEDMPFYTYRPGNFNLIHMHSFSQNRMFVLLGDNDAASSTVFQPGAIVLDGENEQWVLDNCTCYREAGDLIALYPIRASGAVLSSHSVGVAVQRYEMFRGLYVEEWILLDVYNKRAYMHTTVSNMTDRSVTYYTSSKVGDTVQRILPKRTMTVYAFADFDDPRLTTRLLCHPMDIQAFFGQSQEATLYTSFLENGRVYYALSAEDEINHAYIIARDDMVDIGPRLRVGGMDYRFETEYNQYVRITPRLRPHVSSPSSSSSWLRSTR